MLGGKGGLGNLMKQAQKMQDQMQKAQEEIALLEVTGEAGAGMVKVVMTGRHDVKKVTIDPSLITDAEGDDDREVLEDLVAAAVNDAVRKIEKETQDRMGGVTSGLPAGFKLPF